MDIFVKARLSENLHRERTQRWTLATVCIAISFCLSLGCQEDPSSEPSATTPGDGDEPGPGTAISAFTKVLQNGLITTDCRAFWCDLYPSIWPLSNGSALVANADGHLYEYKSRHLVEITIPTTLPLVGIWGTSDTNIYVSSHEGVLHFDGSNWALMRGSPPGGPLWGSSHQDLFLLLNTSIAHFDGRDWTRSYEEGAVSLWGISGTSPRDVYAVGNHGTILHFDGKKWTDMSWHTQDSIVGVFALSPTHVYAVGRLDQLLHYDGKQWDSIAMPDEGDNHNVWAASATEVYVSGEAGIRRFDGNSWTTFESGEVYEMASYTPGKLLTTSNMGIGHLEQGKWESRLAWSHKQLRDLSIGPSGYAVGVGVDGYSMQFDGVSWTHSSIGRFGSRRPYSSVWVADPEVISASGSTELATLNGERWSVNGRASSTILANFVAPSGKGVAIGLGGGIYHFEDDGAPESIESPTNEALRAIWGDDLGSVYIVGDAGTILSHNGESYTEMTSGVKVNLLTVSGLSETQIFAGGEGSTVIFYDGKTWAPFKNTGLVGAVSELCALGPNSLCAIAGGNLYHFDGSTWSAIDTGIGEELVDLAGNPGGDIYVLDSTGAVAHATVETPR